MGVLVVVIALLGGFVALDRVVARQVEGRLAAEVTRRGYAADPDVVVRGFPVLTQLARRRLARVEVRALSLTVRGLRVRSAVMDLRGVRPVGSGARAESLRLVAVVPFAEVESRLQLPVELAAAGDGALRVRRTVTWLGREIEASAIARVVVTDGRVVATPTRVDLPGGERLDDLATAALRPLLRVTVPLRGLPPGTKVASATVTQAGFLVVVTGQDVGLEG